MPTVTTRAHTAPQIARSARTVRRMPADLAAIAPVRAEIGESLRRWGWPDAGVLEVVLAASEAMVNAVEHGSAPGGFVTVDCDVDADAARVIVSDEGSRRPSGPDRRNLPPDPTRGRGMRLIIGLAAQVRYDWSGTGTMLSMRFDRPPS